MRVDTVSRSIRRLLGAVFLWLDEFGHAHAWLPRPVRRWLCDLYDVWLGAMPVGVLLPARRSKRSRPVDPNSASRWRYRGRVGS